MEDFEKLKKRAIELFGPQRCKKGNWIHPKDMMKDVGFDSKYPIVVIRDTQAPEDDMMWYSSEVYARVDDVLELDLDGIISEYIPNDEDELEEYAADAMYDDFGDLDDDVYDRLVEEVVKSYRPYWIRCVVITVRE